MKFTTKNFSFLKKPFVLILLFVILLSNLSLINSKIEFDSKTLKRKVQKESTNLTKKGTWDFLSANFEREGHENHFLHSKDKNVKGVLPKVKLSIVMRTALGVMFPTLMKIYNTFLKKENTAEIELGDKKYSCGRLRDMRKVYTDAKYVKLQYKEEGNIDIKLPEMPDSSDQKSLERSCKKAGITRKIYERICDSPGDYFYHAKKRVDFLTKILEKKQYHKLEKDDLHVGDFTTKNFYANILKDFSSNDKSTQFANECKSLWDKCAGASKFVGFFNKKNKKRIELIQIAIKVNKHKVNILTTAYYAIKNDKFFNSCKKYFYPDPRMDVCKSSSLNSLNNPIYYEVEEKGDFKITTGQKIMDVLTGVFNVFRYTHKCLNYDYDQQILDKDKDFNYAGNVGLKVLDVLMGFIPGGKAIINLIKTFYWGTKYLINNGNTDANSVRLGKALGYLVMTVKTMIKFIGHHSSKLFRKFRINKK